MMKISIFGSGNMGQALKDRFQEAGNTVEFIDKESEVKTLGDIVILAVPYFAVPSIIDKFKNELTDKVLVDITNPVNMNTFDGLLVLADSSAAAEIAKELPKAHVLKAFNTTFAGALASKKISGNISAKVLIAGDSQSAKEKLINALKGSGLDALDVGSLKRARELEAIGFLNISLAAAGKIEWTSGFHLFEK